MASTPRWPWRKVLCAVDFSPSSQAALEQATLMAVGLGAEVLLVHVLEDPVSLAAEASALNLSEVLRIAEEQCEIELGRMAQALRDRGVGGVQTAIAHDTPPRAIVDLARREQVDVIVMGTLGRSGLKHFLLGSVAERVVRSAPCPVLTISSQRSKEKKERTPASELSGGKGARHRSAP